MSQNYNINGDYPYVSASSQNNYKSGGGFDFDLYKRNEMLLSNGISSFKAMKTVCYIDLYLYIYFTFILMLFYFYFAVILMIFFCCFQGVKIDLMC